MTTNDDQHEHWAALRAAGSDARAKMLATAPTALLDAIAWTAGATGTDSIHTAALIDQARNSDPPFTFPQIVAALGLPPETVDGFRTRHAYRRRTADTSRRP